jgi:hypothetical protein
LPDETGTTPDLVSIQADPAGLTPGPHIGEIRVNSAGAQNSPLLVPVTLLVDEPPPAFSIQPASLFFQAEQDGPLPDPQELTVGNAGGGELSWTASGQGDWFDLAPASGSGAATVSVAPSTTALNTGTHVGTIEFSADGAETVKVQLSYRISLIECQTNQDCDDGNPCTSDACLDGACRSNPVADCCTAPGECDDGDDCTEDRCTDNLCEHVNLCCQVNADCEDGNECTEDYCGPDGRCHQSDEDLCSQDEGCGCGAKGRGLSGLLLLPLLFALRRNGPKARSPIAA